MMCVCHRCQRLAAAMDGDVLVYTDDDVADVVDQAFRVADAHGSAAVGIEHVLHAMTSLDFGNELLTRAGIDAWHLREVTANAIVRGDCTAGGDRDDSIPAAAIDEDVHTAIELAIAEARAAGFEVAGLEDLLYVLMHYEPADATLNGITGILHSAGYAQSGRAKLGASHVWMKPTERFEGHSWRGAGPAVAGADAMSNAQFPADRADHAGGSSRQDLEWIAHRLDAIEARAEEDRQRIVHALRELSRQRERLPGAEDWRSQMQDLVMQIDALRRGIGPAVGRAEGTRVSAAKPSQSGSDWPVLSQPRTGADKRPGPAANAVASAVSAAREISSAGVSAPVSQSASVPQSATGAMVIAAAASSSRTAASAGSASSQSSTGHNSRQRTRRRHVQRARTRRRSWRRFGRLRFTSVARFGMRRRPVRRERSWWPYLSDRDGWRAARARAGRYRMFGERFDSPRMRREAVVDLHDRSASTHGETGEASKRFYLSIDDDVVDGPSIGPKTAERLRPARIFTVRDLLNADPDEVASIVTARHITADAVRAWQAQARLVITVPFLRGTHAQLLVGAGFRTYEEVALADQATLMASILRFATTREGQSVLRNGPPPDVEKVVRWMENAIDAEPARAA